MTVKNIDVIYEDDGLLIVSKPSGLPTQSTVDKKRENLFDLLRSQYSYLGLHHRLDVPTSGLVLLTKKKELNKAVGDFFKNHEIQKSYLALIQGRPESEEFAVKNHLKAVKMKSGKTKMQSTHSGGDYAETHFKVLKQNERFTLLQARPKTGRMHQIRVHLSELKFPVVGDALYGRPFPGLSALCLHAWKLEFIHPVSKKQMEISTGVPQRFSEVSSFF